MSIQLENESMNIVRMLQRQSERIRSTMTILQDIAEFNDLIAYNLIQRLQLLESRIKTLEEKVKEVEKKSESG